jgi:hypothetical protein
LLRALAAFEQALADAQTTSDAKRRNVWTRASRERIASLTARIPLLVVAGVEPGSSLSVDGGPAVDFAQPLRLNPGRHQLMLSAPGKQSLRRDFELEAGRKLELHLPPLEDEVAAAPVETLAAPEPTAAPPEPDASADGFGVWPWAVGGAGAALLGTSLITGLMASSKAGRLEDECPGRVCVDPDLVSVRDSASTLALATDVLWITGAVALGVGATLLVIDGAGAGSAEVSAGCFDAGCGLRASGRF